MADEALTRLYLKPKEDATVPSSEVMERVLADVPEIIIGKPSFRFDENAKDGPDAEIRSPSVAHHHVERQRATERVAAIAKLNGGHSMATALGCLSLHDVRLINYSSRIRQVGQHGTLARLPLTFVNAHIRSPYSPESIASSSPVTNPSKSSDGGRTVISTSTNPPYSSLSESR
jgi:hypothetical protein